MRVQINLYNNQVDSCEVTGATGQEAQNLLNYLLKREAPPKPVYPPALPPTYVSVDVLREAVATVYEGNNKIRCIKMVRQLTGWGLKESKDFVETVAPRPNNW